MELDRLGSLKPRPGFKATSRVLEALSLCLSYAIVGRVPDDCPRLLINLEKVGEVHGEGGSRA